MAVAGFGIVLSLAVLGIFFALGKLSAGAMKVYTTIYNALVWNSLLRYVLQSTLKLQISAAAILQAATTTS